MKTADFAIAGIGRIGGHQARQALDKDCGSRATASMVCPRGHFRPFVSVEFTSSQS